MTQDFNIFQHGDDRFIALLPAGAGRP